MNYLNRLFEPTKPAELPKPVEAEAYEPPRPERKTKARPAKEMTAQRAKIERQLKSQTMHVRLPNDLHDALLAKAMQYDISISQLVRLVLQKAAEPGTKLRLGVDFKG